MTLPAKTAAGRGIAVEVDRGQMLLLRDVDADASAIIPIASESIFPIVWHRRGQVEARLPLLMVPGSDGRVIVDVLGVSHEIVTSAAPRVTIDARAYAQLTAWRPMSSPADRRTTLLLAVGFSVTLLLASLLQRGRAIALVGVSVAWSTGMFIAAERRTTLITRDEDGVRWFLALTPQTLRLPIDAESPWVPIVESMEHLRTLSPRIEVEGGTATIQFTLPAGAKVGFEWVPRLPEVLRR